MAKKQYFLIVDTETTIIKSHVADFGAVICDRHGKIYAQIGVLVGEYYNKEKLFHDVNNAQEIWTLKGLAKREENYKSMLKQGTRMLASVTAVNKWLQKAIDTYNPTLTAYNLAFDLNTCLQSGIDLSGFTDRFCLWHAALGNLCNTKKYKKFVLNNHLFNNRTKFGNLTFKTSAEVVSHFVTGNDLIEPHSALEDILLHELFVLVEVLLKRKWREKTKAYSWREHQARDHFTAI